jgi:hypothetical protein
MNSYANKQNIWLHSLYHMLKSQKSKLAEAAPSFRWNQSAPAAFCVDELRDSVSEAVARNERRRKPSAAASSRSPISANLCNCPIKAQVTTTLNPGF